MRGEILTNVSPGGLLVITIPIVTYHMKLSTQSVSLSCINRLFILVSLDTLLETKLQKLTAVS